MSNFKLIKEFSAPYKINVVFGLIFAVLSVVLTLLLPQITQLFIDSVYSFSDIDTGNLGVIWYFVLNFFGQLTTLQIVLVLSIAFLITSILKNTFSLFSKQNLFRVCSEACGDVRKAGFKKLAFADKNLKTSEVFFNYTSDISDLYDIIYIILPKMFTLPVLILFTLVFSFIINWQITLAYIIWIPIMLLIGYITNKKLLKMFNETRIKKSDLLKTSEEMICKIKEIKSFGNENWAVEKFNTKNEKHCALTKESFDYIHKCNLLLNIFKIIGFAIAVIFSAYVTFNGYLSIGYFVLIMLYALMLLNAVVDFINNIYNYNIGNIGVGHLKNLLNMDSSIKEDKKLCCTNPDIKIENAGIFLNSKTIFENLNIDLKYGKHYAIVIPQGKGKTAICRLLLRYIALNTGNVYFNDIPYEKYNIVSLRKQFSFITQEPYIFEGTIANNIAMFDEIDEKKLAEVIKICELTSLVNEYTDGANHWLTENGANLPAQEKQKINIARGLYRNAPILLMDSIFNKFNSTFTKNILTKIFKQYKNKTIIFMSDKNDYVNFFDEIIEPFKKAGGKK